jgi:hypothetical protein
MAWHVHKPLSAFWGGIREMGINLNIPTDIDGLDGGEAEVRLWRRSRSNLSE